MSVPSSYPAPASADVVAMLRGVVDPELGDNIVDLGMVRDVHVDTDGRVEVEIALTVAACPLRTQIETDVRSKLDGLPGVTGVDLRMGAMDADEKSALMSRARLRARDDAAPTQVPPTTRVVAVSSGKGGVGKTTTAVNLAVALRDRGFTVGVMDADIWGFSVPRMLGVEGRLGARDGKIVPHETDGLKVVSMGNLVEEEGTALMWRGLVLARAVEQFLHDVAWGEMDYLVVDMPPGTGDVQMGLARMLPQAEMLVVTTPQLVAQRVAARAGSMARRSHMKVVGVVENMSGFTCEHGTHYDLFGSGGGEALAAELGVPLVARVPLDPATVTGGDLGTPVVETAPESPAATAYRELACRIAEELMAPPDMAGCTARIKELLDGAAP
ncbi:MAG: P-loop NTPase [Acidimicrobiia bacterium]